MKTGLLSLLLLASTFSMVNAQNVVWATVLNDVRSRYDDINHISVDSLATWMKDHETPLLIDVREADEYAVSHLQGAINLDPDAVDFEILGHLPKDTPIIAYCSVGYRSSAMARKLKEAGFTNVSNLEGSIFAWANSGNPVYRGEVLVQAVHPYNTLWGTLLKSELRKYE